MSTFDMKTLAVEFAIGIAGVVFLVWLILYGVGTDIDTTPTPKADTVCHLEKFGVVLQGPCTTVT